MSDSPFSADSVNRAVAEVEARQGNSVDVGVEAMPGGRPSLTLEAQGSEGRMSWAAWAKTQLTKASTAIGAKIGVRW